MGDPILNSLDTSGRVLWLVLSTLRAAELRLVRDPLRDFLSFVSYSAPLHPDEFSALGESHPTSRARFFTFLISLPLYPCFFAASRTAFTGLSEDRFDRVTFSNALAVSA